MRQAFFKLVLLPGLVSAGSGSVLSGAFEISPRHYGTQVNRVLKQAEASLRFRLVVCHGGSVLECRFSSEHVTVQVQGHANPPRTTRIILEADLLRDKPGASPLVTVVDAMRALGATMVVFDPKLEAESRIELLTDLSTTALDSHKGEGEGVEAQYALTFDEAASGLLRMTVTPAERTGVDGLADLAVR